MSSGTKRSVRAKPVRVRLRNGTTWKQYATQVDPTFESMRDLFYSCSSTIRLDIILVVYKRVLKEHGPEAARFQVADAVVASRIDGFRLDLSTWTRPHENHAIHMPATFASTRVVPSGFALVLLDIGCDVNYHLTNPYAIMRTEIYYELGRMTNLAHDPATVWNTRRAFMSLSLPIRSKIPCIYATLRSVTHLDKGVCHKIISHYVRAEVRFWRYLEHNTVQGRAETNAHLKWHDALPTTYLRTLASMWNLARLDELEQCESFRHIFYNAANERNRRHMFYTNATSTIGRKTIFIVQCLVDLLPWTLDNILAHLELLASVSGPRATVAGLLGTITRVQIKPTQGVTVYEDANARAMMRRIFRHLAPSMSDTERRAIHISPWFINYCDFQCPVALLWAGIDHRRPGPSLWGLCNPDAEDIEKWRLQWLAPFDKRTFHLHGTFEYQEQIKALYVVSEHLSTTTTTTLVEGVFSRIMSHVKLAHRELHLDDER